MNHLFLGLLSDSYFFAKSWWVFVIAYCKFMRNEVAKNIWSSALKTSTFFINVGA